MKTYFLCLANSRKYGERCIAGIELTKKDDLKYSIVRKDGRPKWVRPITKDLHGQIPAFLVAHINLLDVIEIEMHRPAPTCYQSENILFDEDSIKVVDHFKLLPEKLDRLTEDHPPLLFGNRGRAVPTEKISSVNHSLIFIKVIKPEFYYKADYENRQQSRVHFQYKELNYDFPMTDLKFEYDLQRNSQLIADSKQFYFAISLSIEYQNWYYKLVAGVICV